MFQTGCHSGCGKAIYLGTGAEGTGYPEGDDESGYNRDDAGIPEHDQIDDDFSPPGMIHDPLGLPGGKACPRKCGERLKSCHLF